MEVVMEILARFCLWTGVAVWVGVILIALLHSLGLTHFGLEVRKPGDDGYDQDQDDPGLTPNEMRVIDDAMDEAIIRKIVAEELAKMKK